MPFGDRTGPAGLGPRTGRGAGFCGGFGFFGGGRGGGGRGWRNRFYATGLTGWQRAFGGPWGQQIAPAPPYSAATGEEELAVLKNQAGYFESALEHIRKRIEALESKAEAG
ncbi:MAG: DUF5320 domain-containing protein [Bryobacteraceae bacterium]